MDESDFEEMVCPSCGGSGGIYGTWCDPPEPCDHCMTSGVVPDYDKPKRRQGMNYSTAVMLINPAIRAIKTIYEPDPEMGKKQQRYTFKTLDQSIKKGDFVVIPTDTRHSMTVVLVDEVDVEMDYESGIEIKWIIDRVDIEGSNYVLKEEKVWIDALKASEKRKKQAEIKKNLVDMYSDAGIDQLPIAKMDNLVTIEHKKD